MERLLLLLTVNNLRTTIRYFLPPLAAVAITPTLHPLLRHPSEVARETYQESGQGAAGCLSSTCRRIKSTREFAVRTTKLLETTEWGRRGSWQKWRLKLNCLKKRRKNSCVLSLKLRRRWNYWSNFSQYVKSEASLPEWRFWLMNKCERFTSNTTSWGGFISF